MTNRSIKNMSHGYNMKSFKTMRRKKANPLKTISEYGKTNIMYKTSAVGFNFKYGSSISFTRSFRGSSKSSTYIGFGGTTTTISYQTIDYADYIKEGRLQWTIQKIISIYKNY